MTPSEPNEEEVGLLEKANRLLRYVPEKIAEARHSVRGGRRVFYDEKTEELRPGKRVYDRKAPRLPPFSGIEDRMNPKTLSRKQRRAIQFQMRARAQWERAEARRKVQEKKKAAEAKRAEEAKARVG